MPAKYITSLGELSQFNDLFKGKLFKGFHTPRIAMVGRSNVGKSSLINILVGKKIADVSKQPGKTRKINFFNWENKFIIADMPGYGFAKRTRKQQAKWEEIIQFYLRNDRGLLTTLILLDSRHGPTQLDNQAMEFLASNKITFLPIFTKFDTLKTQSLRAKRTKEVKEFLSSFAYQEPLWVSSFRKIGISKLKIRLSELKKKQK